jgi:hypothetical protein
MLMEIRRRLIGKTPRSKTIRKGGNMNVTEQDIQKTGTGYYQLPCDGRHDLLSHKYLYYTKKEVLAVWKENHPSQSEE